MIIQSNLQPKLTSTIDNLVPTSNAVGAPPREIPQSMLESLSDNHMFFRVIWEEEES